MTTLPGHECPMCRLYWGHPKCFSEGAVCHRTPLVCPECDNNTRDYVPVFRDYPDDLARFVFRERAKAGIKE